MFPDVCAKTPAYWSTLTPPLESVPNLPRFIEEVYNEKRVYSRIGYLTPSELENAIAIDPSIARRFELQL